MPMELFRPIVYIWLVPVICTAELFVVRVNCSRRVMASVFSIANSLKFG